MTVNAARRPRRRAAASAPLPEPAPVAPIPALAIGEIHQTVFDCPKCARPLAIGARRCPGCGTRLVLGVPMAKASVIATVGLAVGLLAGSAGGFAWAATHLVAAPAPAAVLPSVAPTAGGRTTTIPSAAPVATALPTSPGGGPVSGMPAITRSALTQAITVDDRLVASGDALRAALAMTPFDASEVAQVLRSISADSVYGAQLADRVSSWPDASTVGGDLAALYRTLHDTASAALVNSVRNETAYRDSARAMLELLAGVPAVDGRARDLAAVNGVTLPASSVGP